MSHQITVLPSQTQFTAEAHETILAAALRQNILLPHSCQGGVCGSCAAQLISGSLNKNSEYDDYVLTEAEIAAGTILLCCSQADGDVQIAMPSYAGTHAQAIRTFPARVANLEIHGDVAILAVALTDATQLTFRAGQYMEILLPEGGSRHYAIANAPHQTQQNHELIFHIQHRPNGLFSSKLFSGSLKSGDIIRVRGALGANYVQDESNKPLILIYNQTGFAPMQAILQHLIAQNSPRRVHLFHDTHTRNEYSTQLLPPLLQALPKASYTPVSLAKNDLAEPLSRACPNLHEYEIHVCGTPELIVACQNWFPENGLHTQAFTPHI